jgi:predicted Zn-dependent peptidase
MLGVALLVGVASVPAAGQESGRAVVENLRFPPLRFDAPAPEVHEVEGVRVLFLEDHTVPLVTLFARFRGGYSLFDRSLYAAATALPALLRYGGTTTLSPDSVDEALEYYALQTSFGGGGETVFSSLNTLTDHLGPGLDLWFDMLRSPSFDSAQVEVWRGRELESVRRRPDDPQRLAFSQFNRLMYGDHPVGWEMTASDLEPSDLTSEILHEVHGRILCPDNLIIGVTGDVTWRELEGRLRSVLRGWSPCTGTLPEYPEPQIRATPGVFIIPRDLEQSILVMAHPTDIHLGDGRRYFAAQIGNAILGAGGFSSRIMARVRTEEGYAYSASSIWTMPRRYQGIIGAVTRTRPENTVPALRLILDIMKEMSRDDPTREEVGTAVDQIVNGFVFNFETLSQIVSRRMFYLAQDLPDDWLEQYVSGVEGVTPASVHSVLRENLRPDDMIILVVGDPERIGREALERLGPVTVLDPTAAPG